MKKQDEFKSYKTIPLKELKRAVYDIENNAKGYSAEGIDEIPVAFEYIISRFFPEIMRNIQTQFNQQYTSGYFDGRKDMKEEIKNGTEKLDD